MAQRIFACLVVHNRESKRESTPRFVTVCINSTLPIATRLVACSGLRVAGLCGRLEALGSAGIQRLVLLGGARLAADLLAADCVDALQLTLVPRILGGGNTWMPTACSGLPEALSLPEAWSDEGAYPLGGGEWLLRYRRLRNPPIGGVHG